MEKSRDRELFAAELRAFGSTRVGSRGSSESRTRDGRDGRLDQRYRHQNQYQTHNHPKSASTVLGHGRPPLFRVPPYGEAGVPSVMFGTNPGVGFHIRIMGLKSKAARASSRCGTAPHASLQQPCTGDYPAAARPRPVVVRAYGNGQSECVI
jgi:hypothetical protein